MSRLDPGAVAWVQLDPTIGREQKGTRPAVIIASRHYLAAVPELVIVVPATTRDRGWPHHVRLTGAALSLPKPTYAMTEQPRTISRRRITEQAGCIDDACMYRIVEWLDDFFHRPTRAR